MFFKFAFDFREGACDGRCGERQVMRAVKVDFVDGLRFRGTKLHLLECPQFLKAGLTLFTSARFFASDFSASFSA